ncbi:MAG: precorrin-4 C(11)-methyltransferase [Hyphomicrobiales bacterium]|nr:precorrin-4 C(11)-methyltransferase [Hyphomicrobiales bacterium]
MTVHFIGAGPGAADLLTLRAKDLIASAELVLYAGSLVPKEVLAHARTDACVVDSAPLTLDEIIAQMSSAHAEGKDVARVHSGDPSLYGAIGEQMRRLRALGINYDVTPGVPAYAAAAAALCVELTLPDVSQSIVLTRTQGKASAMPKRESLDIFAATGSTLAIHLSIRNLSKVCRTLEPHYGNNCPTVVAYRVGWEDEAFVRGTLESIVSLVRPLKITRTALILVGRVLEDVNFSDSRLYDETHVHVLRPKRKPNAVARSPNRKPR